MKESIRFVGFMVISIFLLVSASPLALGEVSSTFYFSTSTNRVKLGETFEVYVAVNTTESVGALDLELEYPSELLSLVSVDVLSKGAFMQFKDEGGRLRVSMVSLSGIHSGKFLLIRFEGKFKGVGNIKLKILEAATPDVQELTFSTMNSTVEVLVFPVYSSTTSTSYTKTQTSTTSTSYTPTYSTTPENSEASTTTTHSSYPLENGTETQNSPSQPKTPQTQSIKPPKSSNISQVTSSYPSHEWVPVFVSSKPSGAEIYLEGKFIGRTPIKVELPPGTYKITAVLNSQKEDRTVEIKHSEREYTVTFRFSVNSSDSHETHLTGKICGPGSIILVLLLFSRLRR